MKKILFIDRDGTLLKEPADEQVDSLEKLLFLPGVLSQLGKIVDTLTYELVMVTNQDGLGTSSFPEATFWPAHSKMLDILAGEGIKFREILIDKSLPADKMETRKPGTGLLQHYMQGGAFDLSASYVIGDRDSDVQLAENLGSQSIFIGPKSHNKATFSAKNWADIHNYLTTTPRRTHVLRKTHETDIRVSLVLDGSGKSDISTGLAFFDHMLEQIAKHGQMDLSIYASGDLKVDEHHTIEDVAIALGEAFSRALGDKRGIERYGFLLPMDDCLAQVAIDFGGRAYLLWEATFSREMIGKMPSEMFVHFFKSFSDHAKCNLYIKADGTNEHHKIEAIFKAFACAIKMAVQKNSNASIPSTKGRL